MIDRATTILRRLSSAFRQDAESNNYKLLKIHAEELDEIDSVIGDIIEAHNVEYSSGESLDLLAELLELERGELSDDDFRATIEATSVFRRSNGTIDDIKNLVSSITGVPVEKISITEPGETSFSIILEIPNEKSFSIPLLTEKVCDAKAAGVKYLSTDLITILNRISEIHRTLPGSRIIRRTSEFQYGLSIYGEGTYGDPCELHTPLKGTVYENCGYGLTPYGLNYGDPLV